MQAVCSSECSEFGASVTLDDDRLPLLTEVLCCAGVPWSARAVSRRIYLELEPAARGFTLTGPKLATPTHTG